MITIRNKQTGETKKVFYTEVREDGLIYNNEGRTFGKRFINSWAGVLTQVEGEGEQRFMLSDDWEVATKETKQRQPRVKKAKPQPAQKADTVDVVDEQPAEVAANVPQASDDTADSDTTNEQALIAALRNLRGGAVNIDAVRKIVREEFETLAKEQPKKAAVILKKAQKGQKKEVYCQKFDRITAKVGRGNNVYLHGPAGSGKSHTGEQVAEALGLTFYGQTTIQFAHDVRGYGDAGGKFQDTPFYKAFAFGGLYFQDEYDRSNAEAAIVLNSALANGWYDFPVVGRVEAHPNFRFMAAGNTLMTGPDEEYITGQEIDPSSRDRFGYFFEIGYSREVELTIAHGNEEIVNFVEDVRQAVKEAGLKHVCSYRATAAMTDEIENENDLVACCDEAVFKGLDIDARREIFERLQNKNNRWAKALKKLI